MCLLLIVPLLKNTYRLAARLLLAMPPRKQKVWTNQGIPDKAQEQLTSIFDWLFELKPATSPEGELYPADLQLTPAAHSVFVNFYNQHNAQQIELCGNEAAAWSKLECYAARLAMVIHLVRCASGENIDDWFIDERSMLAGTELCNWLGNETMRVYAVLKESDDERQLRRLCELISNKGNRVSVRDWQRIRHHTCSDDARSELANLVNAGLGYWQYPETGGRPS